MTIAAYEGGLMVTQDRNGHVQYMSWPEPRPKEMAELMRREFNLATLGRRTEIRWEVRMDGHDGGDHDDNSGHSWEVMRAARHDR
jgi:hypothetical protein